MPAKRPPGLVKTGFHLPYNPGLVQRAREMRKNPTAAEKKLWMEYLRNFKYRVLRQRSIDNYIVDFYCAKLKLVIEVDGDSHFNEEAQAYDEQRTRILEGYGLRVLRFTNTEVLQNFEAVGEAIERIPPDPPYKGGDSGELQNFEVVLEVSDGASPDVGEDSPHLPREAGGDSPYSKTSQG
jgi:very-short-patch-repair endonuclease